VRAHPRRDDHDVPGAGRFQDGKGIRDVLFRRVPRRVRRTVRPAVADAVPGDHPVVPREVGHLHLPEARGTIANVGISSSVRVPLAEHLVADPRAASLDEPGLRGLQPS
jgi:hypothetical protein